MATTTIQKEAISAKNILKLFPNIQGSSDGLVGHDAEQIRLMDEICIVLDENDKPIGNLSKKICLHEQTMKKVYMLTPLRSSNGKYR